MLSSLIDSSTIPVLEQVVNFTQSRHGVLAGNIANLDTPGYLTRDLSPTQFQERLKEAVDARRETAVSPSYAINAELRGVPSLGNKSPTDYSNMQDVRDSIKNILYHDMSDISIERQVAEISKNQAQHNMALAIMSSQFRLLRAAISERA